MKPAPFAYVSAGNLAEALSALEQYGTDAKIVAGGQSLLPAMNMRLARPAYLVDINGLAELSYIREVPGGVAIGALTRHHAVETSEVVRQVNPLVHEAVKHIGHFQIRNRGTIGGSLSHNDPTAEYCVVASLMNAEIVLTSAQGERVVPAKDFFITYFTTDIRPGELLTEVRIPALAPNTGYAFLELVRRHGDFAIVSVAATLAVHPDGTFREARVALGGVGGVPHVAQAPARLLGVRPTADALEDVANAVAAEVEPDSDATATSDYRRHLAGVLTRRALETALGRTKGEV